MNVIALKEYKTYLYDENGNPIFVQLDLRNDVMREFYEQMMEDFEDIIDAFEALKESDQSWRLSVDLYD